MSSTSSVTLSLSADGEDLARRIIDIEEGLYHTLDALAAVQPVEQALTAPRTLVNAFLVAEVLCRQSQRAAETNSRK